MNKVQGRATFVDIETTALRPKAPLGAIWEAGAARRTTPKDIAAQMEKGIYGPYLEDVNTLVQPLVHKRTPEGEVTYGEQIPQEELSPWTKGSIENEARTKLETRRDYGTTTGSPLVDQMVDEAKSSGKSLEPLVGDIYQSQLNRLYGQGVMPTLANVPAAELEGFFGKGPIHPTEMLGQLYGSMRGRDVWIQNLKFESSWLGELTPREQWENWVKEGKLQTFGWLESMEEQQTRAAGHKPGLPQGRMFQTAPKIDTAVSRAFETGKLEDWESVFTKGFMPELEGIRPEGMTRILDSQTLSQSIFAMAQQRGYMRKSYDVFTGTNINILNYLLTGNREAHRAFMDASVTGNIVDWMLIQGKAMAEGRPISEFAERFFSTMGHIQPMMKERAQVKTLAGAYHQLLEGEPWEAVTAYEPRLKDVFGWEGEDVKWLGQKMVNIRKTKNLASIEDVVGFLKERQAFNKRGNVDYDRILALTQEEIIGPAVAAAEGPEGLAKSVFKQMGAWDKATEEELVQYASKYAEGGAGFWGRMARKGGRAAPYLLGAGALVLGAHALFGGPKEPETRPAPVGGLGLASMLGPWAPIASKADIVRASSLGKSPLDLYNYMTGAEEPVSDFAKVSMTTGTALHQLLQQQGWAQGNVAETEQFVYDPVNQVTGHLDVRFKTGEVIDIKTVSPKRWRAIQEGPDPEHIPQTNFYGIMTGAPYVGIQYVRADKPEMTKLYTFTPSEEM